MFIGHFAVALGVKRLAPEANLGTTVLAATFLDVVWPVFVAAIVIADIVGTAVAVIWAAWADRHRMPAPART